MFQSPEPGTYLFMITVATYDGKHCDLSLRKNGKVIVTLNDKQVISTLKILDYTKNVMYVGHSWKKYDQSTMSH